MIFSLVKNFLGKFLILLRPPPLCWEIFPSYTLWLITRASLSTQLGYHGPVNILETLPEYWLPKCNLLWFCNLWRKSVIACVFSGTLQWLQVATLCYNTGNHWSFTPVLNNVEVEGWIENQYLKTWERNWWSTTVLA